MCESPYGTCQHCGSEGPLLIKNRYFYGIECRCHSYPHFDRMELCQYCFDLPDNEVFPKYTKISVYDKNKRVKKEIRTAVHADTLIAIGINKLLSDNNDDN